MHRLVDASKPATPLPVVATLEQLRRSPTIDRPSIATAAEAIHSVPLTIGILAENAPVVFANLGYQRRAFEFARPVP